MRSPPCDTRLPPSSRSAPASQKTKGRTQFINTIKARRWILSGKMIKPFQVYLNINSKYDMTNMIWHTSTNSCNFILSISLNHGNRDRSLEAAPWPTSSIAFMLLAGQTYAVWDLPAPCLYFSYLRHQVTWQGVETRRSVQLGTKPNPAFTSRGKLTRTGSKKRLEGKKLVCTILPSDSRLECLHSWWSSGHRVQGRSSLVYSYTCNRHGR